MLAKNNDHKLAIGAFTHFNLVQAFKKKKQKKNFILHHGQADTEVIIKKAGLTVKTCLGLL